MHLFLLLLALLVLFFTFTQKSRTAVVVKSEINKDTSTVPQVSKHGSAEKVVHEIYR